MNVVFVIDWRYEDYSRARSSFNQLSCSSDSIYLRQTYIKDRKVWSQLHHPPDRLFSAGCELNNVVHWLQKSASCFQHHVTIVSKYNSWPTIDHVAPLHTEIKMKHELSVELLQSCRNCVVSQTTTCY